MKHGVPRRTGHYVAYDGRQLWAPVIVTTEDRAHTVESELTDAVIGRIRRHDMKYRGWYAQVEKTGVTLPASGTMCDALFDLLQIVAEQDPDALGLRTEYWGT